MSLVINSQELACLELSCTAGSQNKGCNRERKAIAKERWKRKSAAFSVLAKSPAENREIPVCSGIALAGK